MNYANDYIEDDYLMSLDEASRYNDMMEIRDSILEKLDENALFIIKTRLNPNKMVIK